MYAVEVRDHIMIAHSLPGEFFGPAQGLHGATFVVDVAFFRETLGPNAVVVDIGRAHGVLRATLGAINYKNLDTLPQFKGKLTTTEALARYIFDRFGEALKQNELGEDSKGVTKIRVTLHESHVARAWFEGNVGA
ncbi:MAG: 6-carboxytetrahydropterin synthase [Bradyrhizobiaceae bacterium]|nr:6-carboxytetrahydropterin synthase [Bradyrhizobiaceae bacterium]